jgi:AcrR family transcriptional regulator
MPARVTRQRRHKNYEATHRDIIETAVRLISQRGVDAVSIAALAREMGINRTTMYYHFKTREQLIKAVTTWSSEQLTKGLNSHAPQDERIDYITRFVLDNPELIKLWIEDLISVGDIRARYPLWDTLVKGIKATVAGEPGHPIDAEVYCVILLTSAIIGPRVMRNSVCPDADTETIVRRFRLEQQRLLRHDALLRPKGSVRPVVLSVSAKKRAAKARSN